MRRGCDPPVRKMPANGIPAAASITSRPASGGPPSVFSSYSSRNFSDSRPGRWPMVFFGTLSSAGDSRCAMIRITSAVTLGSRERQANMGFQSSRRCRNPHYASHSYLQQAPRFPRAIVFRIAAMHHTIRSRRQRLRPVAVRWSGSPPRPPSSGEPPAAGHRTARCLPKTPRNPNSTPATPRPATVNGADHMPDEGAFGRWAALSRVLAGLFVVLPCTSHAQ